MENGPNAIGISPGGSGGAGHRRSLSGGILSRLSLLRPSTDENTRPSERNVDDNIGASHAASSAGNATSPTSPTSPKPSTSKSASRAMAEIMAQQRTRKRKGSLRKAALLGRGAQRQSQELIDLKTSSLEATYGPRSPTSPEEPSAEIHIYSPKAQKGSDTTPRPLMDGFASRANNGLRPIHTKVPDSNEMPPVISPTGAISPTMTYTSTTDDEEPLSMPPTALPSTSYFTPQPAPPSHSAVHRRRPQLTHKPTSPLSIGALSTHPTIPPSTPDWDYSSTEWWGWIILLCTWIVFVVGMGSCLGIWSWAWDVGETPYAPPELEDDPTLPIVGYYPALMILTGVMAWVWVVVAWVGMKYFRHAKISGD